MNLIPTPTAVLSDAEVACALHRAVAVIDPLLTLLASDPVGLKARSQNADGAVGRALDAAAWVLDAADVPGTRNYMGARDPAIDATIAALLAARERPAFVSAVRALDRALTSGFYAIPLFNLGEQWIARWNRIERPSTTALTGYLPETWWEKPGAESK